MHYIDSIMIVFYFPLNKSKRPPDFLFLFLLLRLLFRFLSALPSSPPPPGCCSAAGFRGCCVLRCSRNHTLLFSPLLLHQICFLPIPSFHNPSGLLRPSLSSVRLLVVKPHAPSLTLSPNLSYLAVL